MESTQTKKSSFSIAFLIQKGKVKANGKAPILARIIVNGEMTHFSTKLDILPDRWLSQDYRTVGHTKEEREINETLSELRSMVKRRYHELVNNGESVSAAILKNSVLSLEEKCIMLLPLCDMFTKDYYQLVVSGSVTKDTYQRYVLTRNRLEEFMGEKYGISDIAIHKINHNFIKGFDLYLRSKHNSCNNTASKLIKHFRTMFNLALNNDWVRADPFASYKIQFERVDRGYLTNDELTRLMEFDLKSEKLAVVRDMFLFSCYTDLSTATESIFSLRCIRLSGEQAVIITAKKSSPSLRLVFYEQFPALTHIFVVGWYSVLHMRHCRDNQDHLGRVLGVNLYIIENTSPLGYEFDVVGGMILHGRSVAVNHLLDSFVTIAAIGVE